MPQLLTVGSLFSGIGGIDLGLERTGRFQVAWQVEIDAYCQSVLAKHWPNVTRYGDIRTVGRHNLSSVDVLCGGFPCQDISSANWNSPQGLNGERSGLWNEMYRIICELQPQYILVENVKALTYRGLGTILGDLARLRYDAEWQVLPAAAFGAPHLRKRLFIVAYANSKRGYRMFSRPLPSGIRYPLWSQQETTSETMVLPSHRLTQLEQRLGEPSIYGSDDGLSCWMDRLRGIGNAVVPQVIEYIGSCIAAYHDNDTDNQPL